MKVRITVETTLEDGNIKRRDISRLFRARDKLGPESLGLRLDEAKSLLTLLQEVVVQDQIDEALKANRTCDDCGNLRPIHDDRGRILDTLYGRFRVNSPRLRQCLCQATSVMKNTVLPSLVVDLFPERATAELMRLQAELRSRQLVSRGGPADRNVSALCASVNHDSPKSLGARCREA